MEQKAIWTIGHSNHEFEKFVLMLKSFQIDLVADIRSLPGSNKYPQFNKESMEVSLPLHKIGYMHMKELGGRRRTRKDSRNTALTHPAFRGYADYMETSEFQAAITELENIASSLHTAIMCAESLWWRCHRSMVADYLKSRGWNVVHIMGVSKGTEHKYRQQASIVNGSLTYGI